MDKIRVAGWCAVSSDEQAQDKASIPAQIQTIKDATARLGGELVAVYVADGYSRSSYFDLSMAEYDIPPLKECLANMDNFDVLMCKNYDRFGSLGMPLYYKLSQYNKQLHSVQQPTIIHDPATYKPGADISVPSMIISASQNQVYRISKIMDAFAVGTEQRAKDGKYAFGYPYGYVKVGEDKLEIDAKVASLLVQFPGWYLTGASFREIARRANATNVKSPKGKQWTDANVGYILRNPFYTGKVFYNRGYHSKETGAYVLRDNHTLYDADHEAIWDYAEFERVQIEIKRRIDSRLAKSDYNFTGLIKCAVCGLTLVIRWGHYRSTLRYWTCLNHHVSIRTDRANVLVANELIRLFSVDSPVTSEPTNVKSFADKELDKLRRRLSRLEAENDAGAYTVNEFVSKRKELKAREAELLDTERQAQEAAQRASERARTLLTMRDIIQYAPGWIAETDPREVKAVLSRVVRLVAYGDKTIRAELY